QIGAYRWLLFCFAIMDILVSLTHTCIFPEEYGIDLFSDNRPGYISFTYWIPQGDGTKKWTWLPIITMAIGLSVVMTAAIVIFFCLGRILRDMRSV
ncbi:hypothetical protein PMAYCL1PPCAC_21495, partial [Pristionchus mayeri]